MRHRNNPNPTQTELIFADRLNKYLGTVGATMTQFEKDGVCSTTALDWYLNGKHVPGGNIMKSICLYTGLSADYLLGISNVPTRAPFWRWVDGECRCSKCNARGETTFAYCPNCGERMDIN